MTQPFVHPAALCESASIGPGTRIWAFAHVLPGAVIGGAFVQVIEKYADALTKTVSQMVHLPIELQPWTIYGIVLIVLIYVMPAGIAGGLASLWARFRRP